MAFGFEKTDKYREISEKTLRALEGSRISDEDKKMVCEAVYCYQVVIAEPYNLNMDRVYYNLSRLYSIETLDHADWLRQEIGDNTLGFFCYEVNGKNTSKTSAIVIDGLAAENPDIKREILFHELCHCFSMDYNKFAMKIPNTYIDEAINQAATMKMLEECGITFDAKQKNWNLSGINNGNYVTASSISNGYGYSTVFVKGLEQFYGPEKIYGSKFETGALFDKTANLSELSSAFQALNKRPFGESQASAAHAIAKIIESKYSSPGANLDNYFTDVKAFRDICGTLEINGNKYSMLDIALEKFEIRRFYKESFADNFANNKDILDRTTSCTDFLKMMSLAKQLDGITVTDVMKGSTTRGTSKGFEALEITLGGKTYVTDKYNSTGNFLAQIPAGTFEEGALQSKESFFKGFFAQKDVSKFDLQSAAEISNAILNITSDRHASGLISAAIGDVKDTSAIQKIVENKNISNIVDANGHNILHIASASKMVGATVIDTIKRLRPEEFEKMISAADNNGLTPIHSMILHGNISALSTCSQYIKMDKETINCLSGIVVFDNIETMKNRGYTALQLMVMTHPSLAQKFLSSGADVNMECPNSSILQTAVEAGHLDLIKGLNPQNVDYLNADSESPLAVACRKSDINTRAEIIFELLVNKGADPNIETKNGTPLHLYINSEYCRPVRTNEEERIITDLLEAGANPNKSSQMTIDYERKEILPLQLAGRVFMNDDISSRENGKKSLSPDTVAITELIKHGADPFQPTKDYECLRDYAARTENVAIFLAMAEAGVSPSLMRLNEVNLEISDKFRIESAYEKSDKEYSKYVEDSIGKEKISEIDRSIEDKELSAAVLDAE